ncbi:TPA: helix-turn-helix transcriptional regulator [Candidatus Galligastranaerophilus intestinavium]|uniref:Helix-turn-helix transcriptional regulator n=1 Tax=Candidatus Galligastranaerophilus intestinavium TaxID=2840836 RepID=A0A9D1JYG0_9BACT|nr:helix-turn-helix transcriptional regulator [Candidatus Galligastranaerophilus intestinavium]
MKNTEDISKQAKIYEQLILNQIGAFIANKRNEKNITIRELNKITGVSIGVISDLENAKSMPRVETLIKLAEALEISLSLIFENMKPATQKTSNKSKIIPDDMNKYDKISTLLAGLSYAKEEITDIISYIKFTDYKKQK